MANCQTGARACCEESKKSEDNWSFTEHRPPLLAGLEFLCQGNCTTKVYFSEKRDICTDVLQVSLVRPLCLIRSCNYCFIIAVALDSEVTLLFSPLWIFHPDWHTLFDCNRGFIQFQKPLLNRNHYLFHTASHSQDPETPLQILTFRC